MQMLFHLNGLRFNLLILIEGLIWVKWFVNLKLHHLICYTPKLYPLGGFQDVGYQSWIKISWTTLDASKMLAVKVE